MEYVISVNGPEGEMVGATVRSSWDEAFQVMQSHLGWLGEQPALPEQEDDIIAAQDSLEAARGWWEWVTPEGDAFIIDRIDAHGCNLEVALSECVTG